MTRIKSNFIIGRMLAFTLSILLIMSTIIYFHDRGEVLIIKAANINYIYELNKLPDLVANELNTADKSIGIVNTPLVTINGDGEYLNYLLTLW